MHVQKIMAIIKTNFISYFLNISVCSVGSYLLFHVLSHFLHFVHIFFSHFLFLLVSGTTHSVRNLLLPTEKDFSLQCLENSISRWSTIFDVLSIMCLSQFGSSLGQGAVLGSRNINVSVFNKTP